MAKKEAKAKEAADVVRADHEELLKKVEDLQYKRDSIVKGLASPIFVPILQRWEREIEEHKENLVTAQPKEVVSYQESVKARRSLLATLHGAYEADLEEANRALKEFEEHNTLFLTSEKAEKDNGENGEGTQAEAEPEVKTA